MQRADGKQDKVQQADEVGHRDVTSPLTGNSKIKTRIKVLASADAIKPTQRQDALNCKAADDVQFRPIKQYKTYVNQTKSSSGQHTHPLGRPSCILPVYSSGKNYCSLYACSVAYKGRVL